MHFQELQLLKMLSMLLVISPAPDVGEVSMQQRSAPHPVETITPCASPACPATGPWILAMLSLGQQERSTVGTATSASENIQYPCNFLPYLPIHRVLASTSHPLGSGKTTSILARRGDPDQCPRCLGKVFKAEQVLSANAVYHKACFRCAEVECGRALDSTSYCDSPQGRSCPRLSM